MRAAGSKQQAASNARRRCWSCGRASEEQASKQVRQADGKTSKQAATPLCRARPGQKAKRGCVDAGRGVVGKQLTSGTHGRAKDEQRQLKQASQQDRQAGRQASKQISYRQPSQRCQWEHRRRCCEFDEGRLSLGRFG